jgi:hypothetical protein
MSLKAIIKDAFEYYPAINNVFGIERILNINEKDEHSPLVYHLKRAVVEESKIKNALEKLEEEPNHMDVLLWLDTYLDSHYVMKDLNMYIDDLMSLDKFNSVIEHLVNSFWQGYAELEVAYYLRQLFGGNRIRTKTSQWKIS